MANGQTLATLSILLNAPQFHAGLEAYPLFRKQCAQLFGHFAVFFVEQLRAAFDYRDLDSETREHMGKLYANRAAADNRQASRQVGERYRLYIGDKTSLA